MSKHLWLVCHTPSPNTLAMAKALQMGAEAATDGIAVHVASPWHSQAEDLHNADAIIILTTENLGYMAGATKDWFDRIFYPLETAKQGMPYYTVIRAGMDGTGTDRAITSICSGMQWQPAQPALICKGQWQAQFVEQCYELGQLAALSLDMGIV